MDKNNLDKEDRRKDMEFYSEHSGHCVKLQKLKEGQKSMSNKIESMQKLMLTTAVTGVIAMLALVGNFIIQFLNLSFILKRSMYVRYFIGHVLHLCPILKFPPTKNYRRGAPAAGIRAPASIAS